MPGFPNLTDSEWLHGGTPERIEETILKGRTGAMPPWGPALGDEGVKQVATYVRSLSGQQVDQAVAAAGKVRYMTVCVACHGPEGKGNPMLGAPDLTNDIWLYGGSQGAIEASIRFGRTGQMPSWEQRLGKEKVRVLAAYVLSLRGQNP
jgi:cytochrome c oxidase cbb3-type subunit 3